MYQKKKYNQYYHDFKSAHKNIRSVEKIRLAIEEIESKLRHLEGKKSKSIRERERQEHLQSRYVKDRTAVTDNPNSWTTKRGFFSSSRELKESARQELRRIDSKRPKSPDSSYDLTYQEHLEFKDYRKLKTEFNKKIKGRL